MRYRIFRRHSVSAPKMTIRSHIPWPLRVVVAFVALAVAGMIGAWWASSTLLSAERDKDRVALNALREENLTMRAERDRLAGATASTDSKRVMENSTLKELSDQNARLEKENAKLKEDVAFFEAATTERKAQSTGSAGVAIRRFQVTQDAAAHIARYRILVTRDSKADRDFAGTLQLVVTISQAGKTANITLPDSAAPAGAGNLGLAGVSGDGDAAQFQVSFRSYKRIEGSVHIPAEASLKAVHAKILERGAIRAQQTVTLG